MTIKEAFKRRQIEYWGVAYKPTYDINFINNGQIDSTQFTVNSVSTAEKELTDFFKDFCKDNHLKENCVRSITLVYPN
jgi:hypothetical protein